MEIYQIAKAIQDKINLLEVGRKELQKRAEDKANAISNYDKQLAITILSIKTGEKAEFEGEIIHNPPATLIERIARGICWKERLEADKCESLYKNAIVGLNVIQAELNGLQSIFRNLEEV